MLDTMTMTKTVGALCGALLVFLLGGWVAETIYHTGGGHGEETQAYIIDTGAEAEAAPADAGGVDFATLYAAADPAAGERVFSQCRACHKMDGTDGTGPHLNGIVNKAKAASPGFAYSAVLAGMAGDTWTPENLNAFLENPKGYAPGTKMTYAGLRKPEDRANLIAWLAQSQ